MRDGTASNNAASELCPQKQLKTWLLYKSSKPLQKGIFSANFDDSYWEGGQHCESHRPLSSRSLASKCQGCISAKCLVWQGARVSTTWSHQRSWCYSSTKEVRRKTVQGTFQIFPASGSNPALNSPAMPFPDVD